MKIRIRENLQVKYFTGENILTYCKILMPFCGLSPKNFVQKLWQHNYADHICLLCILIGGHNRQQWLLLHSVYNTVTASSIAAGLLATASAAC